MTNQERDKKWLTLTPRQKAIQTLVSIKQRISEARTSSRINQVIRSNDKRPDNLYLRLKRQHIAIKAKHNIMSHEIRSQLT